MGELEDDSLARDGRGESAISGSAGEAAQSQAWLTLGAARAAGRYERAGVSAPAPICPKTASSYRSRIPISISSIMASVFALRSAALRMGRPTTT